MKQQRFDGEGLVHVSWQRVGTRVFLAHLFILASDSWILDT